MRVLLTAALAALAACGASPPPATQPSDEEAPRPAVRIEWRAEQAANDEVTVTIVIEGKPIELGTLPAATESEPGSPRTCAVRAHPLRTELTCGDLASSYAAELIGEELVISRVESATRKQQEVKRLPVFAGSLAVKPYAMPD